MQALLIRLIEVRSYNLLQFLHDPTTMWIWITNVIPIVINQSCRLIRWTTPSIPSWKSGAIGTPEKIDCSTETTSYIVNSNQNHNWSFCWSFWIAKSCTKGKNNPLLFSFGKYGVPIYQRFLIFSNQSGALISIATPDWFIIGIRTRPSTNLELSAQLLWSSHKQCRCLSSSRGGVGT